MDVNDDVPKFVERLSNATEKSNAITTKSAETVQTIVEILGTIAEVSSPNFTINEPVIAVCIFYIFSNVMCIE